MDEDLAWINEHTERKNIDEVRNIIDKKLPGNLNDLPADLCDDLQICRFLRGHDNNPSEAAKFFEHAVEYRKDLIAKEPFKSLRAACSSAEAADLAILPHYAEVSHILPVRALEGVGTSGNPIMAAVPRMIDFDALAALLKTEGGDDKLSEFVRAMLEQRAIVLHNLSHKRKSMVKYDDLRDMSQVSIPSLLSSGLVGKLKGMLSVIQDSYPESIHKVTIWSAPPAFSKLFAIISAIMNQRMKAKIQVLQRGELFKEVAVRMDAIAIHSWLRQATVVRSWLMQASADGSQELTIPNGSQELTSVWLTSGNTSKWSLLLTAGADVILRHTFIPAAGLGDGISAAEVEVKVTSGETHDGNFTSECDGVLVLCIDNYYSWWNTKTVRFSLE